MTSFKPGEKEFLVLLIAIRKMISAPEESLVNEIYASTTHIVSSMVWILGYAYPTEENR
jgi:hypothetical protein